MKTTFSIFDSVNQLFFLLVSLLVLIPLAYMVAVSLSPAMESASGNFYLVPKHFLLDAYRYLFSTGRFLQSIGNAIYITAVGTAINLLVSVMLAYALAKKFLPGRNAMMMLVFFTLMFHSGLIPQYLLVQDLGLMNTYWAVILPAATNAFTIMVMKTFFQTLPGGLEEAAKIDGAGEFRILAAVMLPLSKPIIATFLLFFMVSHWNDFFAAIIYLNDSNKWPVQVLLRETVAGSSDVGSQSALDQGLATSVGDNVKMAAILVAMLPIVVVYPFLQKYFAKGAMIGAVKE